jgi:hypothetical protein
MIKEKGTITYEIKKDIKVPANMHDFGIYKHREGYIELSGFRKDPKIAGYDKPNHVSMVVKIPKNAENIRVKLGNKPAEKAK